MEKQWYFLSSWKWQRLIRYYTTEIYLTEFIFLFFFFFSITVKVEFRRWVIPQRVIFRGFVSSWFHISCIQRCTSKGSTSNLFHDYLNNLKSITITLHFLRICSTWKHFYKSFVRPTNSIRRGLILSTNMAEVSLFVNTTTQAVTCLKRKIKIQHFRIIISFSCSSQLLRVIFWNVTGSVAWHP